MNAFPNFPFPKSTRPKPRLAGGAVYQISKRIFDIAASSVALLLSAPAMGVIAILVYRKLGTPIIFSQDRPGKDGRIFRIYKFRTMLDLDSERGLVTDEYRLTTFGAKLRSTSLDELPELVNVLRGEMSIVGPRPLLVEYLELYSAEQNRRHEVRPGVTGLAQCSGRNGLTWEERLQLDAQYVDTRSWRLDLQIIRQTFATVFRREGISADGHATMHAFTGSQTKNRSGS